MNTDTYIYLLLNTPVIILVVPKATQNRQKEDKSVQCTIPITVIDISNTRISRPLNQGQ